MMSQDYVVSWLV